MKCGERYRVFTPVPMNSVSLGGDTSSHGYLEQGQNTSEEEYFISRLTQVFSTSNICIPSSVCFASAVLNTLGHTVTIKNQT